MPESHPAEDVAFAIILVSIQQAYLRVIAAALEGQNEKFAYTFGVGMWPDGVRAAHFTQVNLGTYFTEFVQGGRERLEGELRSEMGGQLWTSIEDFLKMAHNQRNTSRSLVSRMEFGYDAAEDKAQLVYYWKTRVLNG